MKRKKIAIIFGGCSSEYEVSLQSAYAVITHIDQEKYEMVLIGIDQQGCGISIKENMQIFQVITGIRKRAAFQWWFHQIERCMVSYF